MGFSPNLELKNSRKEVKIRWVGAINLTKSPKAEATLFSFSKKAENNFFWDSVDF